MPEPLNLICLHGFLGLPSDWDFLDEEVSRAGLRCVKVDLRDTRFARDWSEWCEEFSRQVRGDSILLGYSLGGRLAMHALAARPELFRGAVLVSAHSGIKKDGGAKTASDSEAERRYRIEADERWARRFEDSENFSWELLMRSWNDQPVFSGSRAWRQRSERDFDRERLAWQLRNWSLGKQRDFSDEMARLPMPLLWVSGEKDEKYVALAEELKPNLGRRASAESWIAPGAGHRVPWDQPELFTKKLLGWIFEHNLVKTSATGER